MINPQRRAYEGLPLFLMGTRTHLAFQCADVYIGTES